jgi:cytochrome c oxidase assembly protein subunit 11
MFGFAFALVPLYDAFCELTGLNGRTSARAVDAIAPGPHAAGREVTVQFLAQVAKGMPWEFRPTETALRVRLGEMNSTLFYARNRASETVTGQAVPSVAPGYAAQYLLKTECFCFTQQQLDGGGEMEMPVRFYVDPELPDEVRTLTLSYALFRVDPIRTAAAYERQ